MTTAMTTSSPDLRTAPLLVDLYERDDALLLTASMPGVRAEDLDIQLEADRLTLTAERHEPVPPGGDDDTVATALFRELGGVRWTRSVRLATPVDPDAVTASLDQGVLQLTLPKAEHARPRTIEIKVG